MSLERTYYCDAPGGHLPGTDVGERCPGHAKTAAEPPHMPHGFLVVCETWPGAGRELHFCGWDCLLRYAANIPPAEIIEAA